MTECQTCGRKTNLYLCTTCTNELQELLTSLVTTGTRTTITNQGKTASGRPWRIEQNRPMPGLIEYLHHAANGQAKLGEQGPKVSGHNETPIKHNPKAANLLQELHEALGQWARHINRTYGPQLDWRTTTGFAHYLATNTHHLAQDQDGGEAFSRIHGLIRQTEKTLNRPQPLRFCGPCPTTLTPDHNPKCEQRHPHQCGTQLQAPRTAIEVRCPTCKTSHRIEELHQRLLANIDQWRFTRSDILRILDGLGEHLPPGTFDTWRARNQLNPRGWQRPDGRIGITRHSPADKPVFYLADVRKLMANRRNTPTRAAASA